MSSNGVLDNDNHGIFLRTSATCYSPVGAVGGEYVKLLSAMTSTAISTLTFQNSSSSSLCGTANTWHIFKTTVTTPNTIWAVKLDGLADMPATLDATNFMECSPTGNFNTTTGCSSAAPAVSAPIDLISSEKPQTFSKEIGLK